VIYTLLDKKKLLFHFVSQILLHTYRVVFKTLKKNCYNNIMRLLLLLDDAYYYYLLLLLLLIIIAVIDTHNSKGYTENRLTFFGIDETSNAQHQQEINDQHYDTVVGCLTDHYSSRSIAAGIDVSGPAIQKLFSNYFYKPLTEL